VASDFDKELIEYPNIMRNLVFAILQDAYLHCGIPLLTLLREIRNGDDFDKDAINQIS